MYEHHPVIDADSHKCENPAVFMDYIPRSHRDRLTLARDRYGEQRFRIRDRDPASGAWIERTFLQPEGYGKGTYRPYHRETTLGGLFNRIRMEHMDREGIDHQVVYGSITLAFNSILDPELAVVLCRAFNEYLNDDCAPYRDRLHPVAVLPLQDPAAAIEEMKRSVCELGMVGVAIPPNLPVPHPDAPDRFPEIRVPKHISHEDFHPLFREAQALDIALGVHGAPGMQLAGGTSDQLDSFTLVHVFANRSMQQMALSRLIFDGVLDSFPSLRFGLLEAGVGWLPDLMHSLHEHWEKRIVDFDPDVQPTVAEFLREFARERGPGGGLSPLRKARQLMSVLNPGREPKASAQELEAFRYEHPLARTDPLAVLERDQLFFTFEPDDPAPSYLTAALGPVGRRLCGMAIDYGHWDATLAGAVSLVERHAANDPEHATQLLSENTLRFYGPRLASSVADPAATLRREGAMR
jgi:predicted TIM-barrel fold metal-dependent hydrolase